MACSRRFLIAIYRSRPLGFLGLDDRLNGGSTPLGGPEARRLTQPEAEALAFLLPLSADYPGIETWYRSKVVPGLRNGTRCVLPVERDGQLVGIGIAKNEPDERKICTVRVAPTHANRGIGVRLFDGLLKWLDCDQPHLTVTDYRFPQFERLFDYYGFRFTTRCHARYVPHASEFGFNDSTPLQSSTDLVALGVGANVLIAPERSVFDDRFQKPVKG